MGKRKKKQNIKKEEVKAKHPKHLYKIILLGFALSGMAALIYEVAWTRTLQLIFGTTVYAVSTMLTAFMAGLALGSWLLGRYTDRIKNPLLAFSILELGIGIYGLLLIPIFNVLPFIYLTLFHTFHGSFTSFSLLQFLLVFTVLLIPTTLMGGTFPVVSKIYTKGMEGLGKDIGNVYSVNTLGAVLGSFSAGFLFIPFVGVRNTIIIAASLNILVAILIFLQSSPRGREPRFFMASLFLFSLIGIAAPSYDEKLLNSALYQRADSVENKAYLLKSLESQNVLYSKEGLYGSVMVTENEKSGTRTLRINGKPDAGTSEIDMKTQLFLAYLPLVLHKSPKKVLIIGLGGGFTLGAAEKFEELEKIDIVEIDPLVVEANKYFQAYNGNALEDERVELTITDARNYLFLTDEKYDVIISEPSNPWVPGEGTLFTKEFFEIVKGHLDEGGIFCQWLPIYDAFPEDFKIVLKTFSQVYEHSTVWQASEADMLFIGSSDPIKMDYSRMEGVLSRAKIKKSLEDMGFQGQKDHLGRAFVMNQEEIDGFVEGDIPLNTDDRPIVEFSASKGIIASLSSLDIVEEINSYKNKTNNPFFVPPMEGLERREGDRIWLDFMGLKMKLNEDWEKKSADIPMSRTYQKSGDVTKLTLKMWKEVKYQSGNRYLEIRAFEFETRPLDSEIMEPLQVMGPVESRIIDGHTAYSVSIERPSPDSGQIKFLFVIWYCEENKNQYLARLAYPLNIWDSKAEEVEDILSNFECLV